ncbi:MAG: alanine racemase C-terminal domain-containing protein, partial [Finegoldia magna]|nr:alanine racemase C-terminal domain-containing protein [Finegoldia magna]
NKIKPRNFDYVKENSRLNLEEISSLYTTVSMIKTVPKGTEIGYGRTFTTNSETVVATATIGYADGYPLELSDKAYVIINGKKAKILGKVCMDQIMIDVTYIRDVKVGDKILLFGKDDMGEISLYDLAEMANTNVYELLCRVTMRIPRIYIRNGKVVEVCDYLRKIN